MYKKLLDINERNYQFVKDMVGQEFLNDRNCRPECLSRIFKRPNIFGPLHSTFEERGIRSLAYVNGGMNSYYFMSTKYQVIKLTQRRHVGSFDEPEILKKVTKFFALDVTDLTQGAIGFEIIPEVIPLLKLVDKRFAGNLAITSKQADGICGMLHSRLLKRNFHFYYPTVENTGILVDGTPIVLDVGDVNKISHPDFIDNRHIIEKELYGLYWDGSFEGKQKIICRN